jgi:hypothetical protein
MYNYAIDDNETMFDSLSIMGKPVSTDVPSHLTRRVSRGSRQDHSVNVYLITRA